MSNPDGSPPGPSDVAQAEVPGVTGGAASPPTAGHARGTLPNAEPSGTPILDSINTKIVSHILPSSYAKKGRIHSRRKPTAHRTSYSWEVRNRSRYHEYVHNLALAGWDNLKQLDSYMDKDIQDTNLVVSILDIKSDNQVDLVEDLYSLGEVDAFLKEDVRGKAKVRLFLVEHGGSLQSSMIDCLGSHLVMDPRFFAANLFGPYMIISPADRHRAPFAGIGFTILKPSRSRATETKFFRVSIYIKHDDDGSGWCGVILFNSHSKVQLSARTLTPPPPFGQEIPGLRSQINPSHTQASQFNQPQSLRELYIHALYLSNTSQATASPFYAICPLIKLNFHCWNEVINAIRTEDRRISDISEASFGHVEEIQHTLALIERFGTLGWQDTNTPPPEAVEQIQAELIEDFKHLLNQTDLLWEERRNMSSVRDRQRQARWSTLTNTFTFIFVPISLISSIYGMNVVEISGSDQNPRIWQFFVACIGLNLVILFMMAASHWVGEMRRYRRKPGVKEVWAFATNMDGR
ncbi:hypothetical protein H072_7606 [Dactylellina haptotyla CBS 200.50]|uniref:Uncharacterized protein n=1 Tax=Dactylellina haptotyla (strain CBS 200.50) TaxID=1284197 RepID=S8ABX0_DACHA|nr:hypothetical protein H072_7606 [Dactylellina haptotyla CBS 200.50]